MSSRSEARRVFFAAAIPVALLTPFITKPFHIDDPLFLWLAAHIQDDPIHFFDFMVNWHQSRQPMYDVTMNPPGVGYLLAVAAYVVGWSETALHAVFLIPAALSGVGVYILSGKIYRRSLTSVFVACVSPAFLVSSTNVMSDTWMLAIYIWAVVSWVHGHDKQESRYFLGAAALIAVGVLVKYLVISVVPLLIVYSIYREGRVTRWIGLLAIPFLVLVAYHFATLGLFGKSMVIGTVGFSAGQAVEGGGGSALMRPLVGLTFVGGCLASAVIVALSTSGRREWAVYVGAVLGFAVLFALLGRLDSRLIRGAEGMRWGFLSHAALFAAGGLFVIYLAIEGFWRERNAGSLLLCLWVLGIGVFAVWVNWTINGRTLLTMAPAVAILVGGRVSAIVNRPRLAAGLVLSALLGLSVTWGDYAMSRAQRDGARVAASFLPADAAGRLLFQGHWGFQYYFEGSGGLAFDRELGVRPGDIVAVPENSPSTMALPVQISESFGTIEKDSGRFVTTMHGDVGAGFYSHYWGPLPFYFGRAPVERVDVYRIRLP